MAKSLIPVDDLQADILVGLIGYAKAQDENYYAPLQEIYDNLVEVLNGDR